MNENSNYINFHNWTTWELKRLLLHVEYILYERDQNEDEKIDVEEKVGDLDA